MCVRVGVIFIVLGFKRYREVWKIVFCIFVEGIWGVEFILIFLCCVERLILTG